MTSVLGLTLEPFSFIHLRSLQAVNSKLLTDEDENYADLVVATLICTHSGYLKNSWWLRLKLRLWLRRVKRMAWRNELEKMHLHIYMGITGLAAKLIKTPKEIA